METLKFKVFLDEPSYRAAFPCQLINPATDFILGYAKQHVGHVAMVSGPKAYVLCINFYGDQTLQPLSDKSKILRCTDLVDKDGREIYVGDLVSVFTPDNVFEVKDGFYKREVVSHNGIRSFPLALHGIYFEHLVDKRPYAVISEELLGYSELKETSVIGNIYDTKCNPPEQPAGG